MFSRMDSIVAGGLRGGRDDRWDMLVLAAVSSADCGVSMGLVYGERRRRAEENGQRSYSPWWTENLTVALVLERLCFAIKHPIELILSQSRY